MLVLFKWFNLAFAEFSSVQFFLLSFISLHSCFLSFSLNSCPSSIKFFSNSFSPFFASCSHFSLLYPFWSSIAQQCPPLTFIDHFFSQFYVMRNREGGDLRRRWVWWNKSHYFVGEARSGSSHQRLDEADYTNREVQILLRQIFDPQSTVLDISMKHCTDLVKSMHQRRFHHSHRRISVILKSIKSPAGPLWPQPLRMSTVAGSSTVGIFWIL